MGNKIKDLAEVEIGGSKYKIELNGGTKNENFDIHIQNEKISICLKDYEFAQFASAVLVANKRIKRFKGRYE